MSPLTVAWIIDFPLEWLDDVPAPLAGLPRGHPASWQRVLLAELAKHPDLRIHVIVLRSEIAKTFSFTRGPVTFHVLAYRAGIRAPTLYWADSLLVSRVLVGIKPDVVHAWGHERGAGLVASRLGHPYLVTIQGLLSDIVARGALPATLRMRLFVHLEARSLRRARHVSVESTYAKDYLRRRYPQLRFHQIEHAPDPVFHAVTRRPSPTLTFLAVGAVGPTKGTDVMLRALARLDEPFEALVVGHVDHAFLDPILAELPVAVRARIRFEGELAPARVADEMARATMLLMPSRAENSPNAVKEAAVVGVPILATDVGGISEHVVAGANGLLCRPDSVDAFAAILRQACRDPRFSRGEVAPDVHARVRSRLSPARMAAQFVAAYIAVAGRRAEATAGFPDAT